MKNWLAIAHAMNLDIPNEQLIRIAPSLDGLESAFAPLRIGISSGTDPACLFRAAVEEAE
jgi:hypothetical protein